MERAETGKPSLCLANVSKILQLSHKLALKEDEHLIKCYNEKLSDSTVHMLHSVNGLSDKHSKEKHKGTKDKEYTEKGT